jgi:hypothetical protein
MIAANRLGRSRGGGDAATSATRIIKKAGSQRVQPK